MQAAAADRAEVEVAGGLLEHHDLGVALAVVIADAEELPLRLQCRDLRVAERAGSDLADL